MYTNDEKTDMMLVLGESRGQPDLAVRIYMRRYPDRIAPSYNTFRRLDTNLRRHGQFIKPRSRTRQATNKNRGLEVLQLIDDNPNISQRAIAKTLGISQASVSKILKNNQEKALDAESNSEVKIEYPIDTLVVSNGNVNNNKDHPGLAEIKMEENIKLELVDEMMDIRKGLALDDKAEKDQLPLTNFPADIKQENISIFDYCDCKDSEKCPHNKEAVPDKPIFRCSMCNYKAACEEDLESHISNTHISEKP